MKTMTVKELREHLTRFDESLPVVASWEGVDAAILVDNFSVEKLEGRPALVIDVENYLVSD